MTVRFQNPWVDPRVLAIRPDDVERYLRNRGWQEAESGSQHWKRFLYHSGGELAVLVPTNVNDESLLNLLVECVGKVAACEGRYAGDLVSDLLSKSVESPVNGQRLFTPTTPN